MIGRNRNRAKTSLRTVTSPKTAAFRFKNSVAADGTDSPSMPR